MSEVRRTGSEDECGFDMREYEPLQDGVTCRGCNHFVLDASDEDAHKHAGWWFCSDCFYALPEVQEALRDVAVRDEQRDEQTK